MRNFITIVFLILILAMPNAFADNKYSAPAIEDNSTISVPDQSAVAPLKDIEPCKDIPSTVQIHQIYTVGVQDILSINVLQPEQITNDVVVSPDGSITFPYIGTVTVKGMTIDQIQEDIQKRLGDGYLKYPVVVVSLKESNSRKFFVYGEVNKPGSYPMEENMTVLRAISLAEGFTRFGSASRVKVLRPKAHGIGYTTVAVNIKSVMDGDSNADLILKSGDIVVVSEGLM